MRIETRIETSPSQAEMNLPGVASIYAAQDGGSGGIRTPGASRHARFQAPRSDVREQPGDVLPLVTTYELA
jgi:hypothetical protein